MQQARRGAPPPERLHDCEARALRGHDGAVLSVRFNAQGTYCLSCGKDRTVRLWNPHRGLLVKTYAGHGYEARAAAAAPDNARFASVGGDRAVLLWDVATGAVARRFRGHDGAAGAVAVSPGGAGDVLASGGADAAVLLWDCRSRSTEPIQALRSFGDEVTSVLFTGRGEIVAASVDGTVRAFDARRGAETADDVRAPATCVAASPDGLYLAAACVGGRVRLLDRACGALLGDFAGHVHESARLDAAFSAGGGRLGAGSEDGRVVWWDLLTGLPAGEVAAHPGAVVTGLAPHPGGECTLTSSVDGTVRVWV